KIEKNIAKAKKYVEKAAEKGAEIVCLPELFNIGYFPYAHQFDTSFFKLAESLDGFTVTYFKDIAKRLDIYIIVSFYEYDSPGLYYNTVALINNNGTIDGIYRKTHIPWSSTGWEKFYMKPGYDYPVFNTPYGKIGFMVCYDRDFPEVARTLALKGAKIIFVPNGSAKYLTETWKNIMQVRAYENQVYMVGSCVTTTSEDAPRDFSGNSLIVNPFGEIQEKLGTEEGILVESI